MEKNTSNPTGAGNGQHARELVNEAGDDIHRSIDKTVQPAVERLTSSAHAAVDRMASTAADVSETLVRKAQELKQTQDRLMVKGRECVRENPATSVALALAAGYLLSKLLGRRA